MSKVEHETSPRGVPVCSVCKQPLEMTIKKRHKTLGIVVPIWGPSPCRNPDCAEYREEPEHHRHQKR